MTICRNEKAPVLQVESVTKLYDGVPVIESISLEVHNEELVALLGISGVGKTTLFNVIAGLDRPEQGRILLEGEDVTGISGKVGYMQQKDLLLPFLRIEDNVALPLRLRGEEKKSARAKARALLEEFGLGTTARMFPGQLSGGMRQRAALLRTALFGGSVMLLDEPFSALDARTRSRLHGWYRDLCRRRGCATLLITHDVEEAILMADRIYLMSGTPGVLTGCYPVPFSQQQKKSGDLPLTSEFLQFKRELLGNLL